MNLATLYAFLILAVILSVTSNSFSKIHYFFKSIKECDGTETNKTLAEILCKKK